MHALQSRPLPPRPAVNLTDIEGTGATETAHRLGLNPAAAASLAYRGREVLRTHYVRRHAAPAEPPCERALDRFVAALRGRATERYRAALQAHLEMCGPCTGATSYRRELNASVSSPQRAG
ncbi:zf-HC2 domain-containing protein [Streptomyces sp. NPDC005728]|uniref:zf-HC2 domain-containing protein n=1 Tax=Streptomyces sp. NPDC005728 TaxID=3157054 RepID=UPI0033C79A37